MSRDRGPFRLDSAWQRMAWWSVAALVGVCFVLGFLVLSRYQQSGPPLDVWNAICRAIGITADVGPAGEPQPPLRTPTRVAWTRATLDQVASGNERKGEFIALNCGACHGEQGVSSSNLIPISTDVRASEKSKGSRTMMRKPLSPNTWVMAGRLDRCHGVRYLLQ